MDKFQLQPINPIGMPSPMPMGGLKIEAKKKKKCCKKYKKGKRCKKCPCFDLGLSHGLKQL